MIYATIWLSDDISTQEAFSPFCSAGLMSFPSAYWLSRLVLPTMIKVGRWSFAMLSELISGKWRNTLWQHFDHWDETWSWAEWTLTGRCTWTTRPEKIWAVHASSSTLRPNIPTWHQARMKTEPNQNSDQKITEKKDKSPPVGQVWTCSHIKKTSSLPKTVLRATTINLFWGSM